MNERPVILGYGLTGKSFEKFLIKKKLEYFLYDDKYPHSSKFLGVKNKFISKSELAKFDTFYVSPGFNKKKLNELGVLDKHLLTDLDIFFRFNESFKIGITGTNGKSSLTHYLTQILNCRSTAISLGNIGNPLLENLDHKNKYSVIELSSFQLEKMKENELNLSVITNISQDHIDYHGNFESYRSCKFKIMKTKTFFYNDECQLQDFAFLIAKSLEPDTNKKLKLEELPFRLQPISKNIINDSKSTNSSSLYYAIKKLNFAGILIMCGNPNKEDYQNLIIDGPAKILIFGKHREEIKKRIIHNNIELYSSLESLISSLDVSDQILFSPGNPSGDDFSNFMERGEYFSKIIEVHFDSK
ncbi:MAG: UDP-N-acetylmuramoylalanine--D-glutamate ligase [SAR86 cluster bacterium]|uniref:UDP-N-acetylmuramoylalanine--D-glutamate ligase n=1 Tax=SAR86 cluster bacterium TaxID=2030880 RepID=A0A937LL20_9GAMM|nr:UDP-N-acetylmuramoylalanine--D-glutamate ligase [SAR86 cluster bacterium]